MDLFELKYTEEIYDLYSRIQVLLDHYLVEHKPIDMVDIYDIIVIGIRSIFVNYLFESYF